MKKQCEHCGSEIRENMPSEFYKGDPESKVRTDHTFDFGGHLPHELPPDFPPQERNKKWLICYADYGLDNWRYCYHLYEGDNPVKWFLGHAQHAYDNPNKPHFFPHILSAFEIDSEYFNLASKYPPFTEYPSKYS